MKNEIFPKNVCVNCKSKLKELFSFKEKTSKSFDLLYEIFGVVKPTPPHSPLLAKMVAAGTQTNEIIIQEKDVNLYSNFLSIKKSSKPPTANSACQVEFVLKNAASQTRSNDKLLKDASVQVDEPTEAVLHLHSQVGLSSIEELLEETDVADDNEDESYTHMDVIDDIEEIEEIVTNQEKNIADTEITDIIKEEKLISGGKIIHDLV